ncbi:MAG: tetratricopeptide repeat protein [Deltaproteobacteria bacterium]
MTRCPTPEALDRAFVEPDAEIDRHIASCDACAREKAEQDALTATLDQLPYAPMSTDRSASMRIALAAAARATPQQRSRKWPVAFVAAAAAVAAAVVLLNGTDATRRATESVAPEVPSPVAKVAPLRPVRPVRPAPVSAVELRDGSPVFEVPALGVTSIVVRTDDAEIRAERARFQVFAEAGSLVRLQVISGVLELRPPGGGNIALEAGESWTAEPAEVEPAATAPVEPRRVVERRRGAPSGSEAREPSATERTALEADTPSATERTASEADRPSATERTGSEAEAPNATTERTGSEADAPSATTESSADGAEPSEPPSPDEAFAHAWRAFRSGDYAAAARNFEIAAEGDGPFAEDACYWRAIAELRRGDEARAVELLDAFLERHPTSARRDEVLRLKDKLLR